MRQIRTLFDYIRAHRILMHVLYWISSLIITPLFLSLTGQSFYFNFIFKLCYLPVQIAGAYFLIYFFIPRFFFQRKYLMFLFLIILSTYLLAKVLHMSEDYLIFAIMGELHPKHSLSEIIWGRFGEAYFLIYTILTPLITTCIYLVKHKFETQVEVISLQKQKAEAELHFLRARFHPHFLIKTLDKLHDLSLQKSDKAPEVIARMSDMLDYMLYRCEENYMPIEQEISLIEQYLELEALQFEGLLNWRFEYQDDIKKIEIAPLLFLSLIEFGMNSIIPDSTKTQVDITIYRKGPGIVFHLTIDGKISKRLNPSTEAYQVYMRDIHKQLELAYPANHYLELANESIPLEYKLHLGL